MKMKPDKNTLVTTHIHTKRRKKPYKITNKPKILKLL